MLDDVIVIDVAVVVVAVPVVQPLQLLGQTDR
jgi:hypothetical protein